MQIPEISDVKTRCGLGNSSNILMSQIHLYFNVLLQCMYVFTI